ncbi:MAG: TIM barrel protein [Kiritimatiellia bacterium]|nr:TIM barrel protein [Kiritimatiellia bacterium]
MPFLSGFADEAAADLDGQIRATRELGWTRIEARNIGGKNIHEIDDETFDIVCNKLQAAGIKINAFGSTVANWGKQVTDPMDVTWGEVSRAIPRMKRLGVKTIRIMSFAKLPDRGPDDQMEQERFHRIREIVKRFTQEGLLPLHENCMNYGGMGWTYTLKLIEKVPGLKLIFDTGNPVCAEDMIKPEPRPKQSSWEFYKNVREHVAHVHIKDGKIGPDGKPVWGFPGEGDGDVRRIAEDLLRRGYQGGFSIEPHMAVVFHDPTQQSEAGVRYSNYVEYGRRMAALLRSIQPDVRLD